MCGCYGRKPEAWSRLKSDRAASLNRTGQRCLFLNRRSTPTYSILQTPENGVGCVRRPAPSAPYRYLVAYALLSVYRIWQRFFQGEESLLSQELVVSGKL